VLGLVAGERLGPRVARRFAATNLAIGFTATPLDDRLRELLLRRHFRNVAR
jgi:hypothetical protein